MILFSNENKDLKIKFEGWKLEHTFERVKEIESWKTEYHLDVVQFFILKFWNYFI